MTVKFGNGVSKSPHYDAVHARALQIMEGTEIPDNPSQKREVVSRAIRQARDELVPRDEKQTYSGMDVRRGYREFNIGNFEELRSQIVRGMK